MTLNGHALPKTKDSMAVPFSNSSSKENEKRPKAHVQAKSSKFLFVDEVKNGTVGTRKNDTHKRRFVMQRARQEKYWSTTTRGIDNRTRNTIKRRSATSSPETSSTSTYSQESSSPIPEALSKSTRERGCVTSRMARFCDSEYCVSCSGINAASLSPQHDALAETKFDPFGVLPMDLDPKSSSFVKHWLTVSTKGGVALDVRQRLTITRDEMFKLAITSKALMHSITCSGSIDTYMRGGHATVADITLYTTRAIAQVNEDLTNPERCIADATIAAVFVLVVLGEFRILPRLSGSSGQLLDASAEQAIHMTGFQKMIELRGGLHSLKHSNRTLQALIIWYVTARASASLDKPCLDIHQVASEYSRKNNPPQKLTTASMSILRLQKILDLSEPLVDIMLDLSLYVPKVKAYLENFEADAVHLLTTGCLIQCRLLSWFRIPDRESNPLEESLALACMIFNTATYSPSPRRFDIMRHLGVERLANTLKETSGAEWSNCPLLLLWILVIGGVRAAVACGRQWFVIQLREICGRLRICNAKEMLDVLNNFLWVDLASERGADQFWNEASGIDPTKSDTKPEEILFTAFEPNPSSLLPYRGAGASVESSAGLSEVKLPPAVWTYRQTTELAVISNAHWKRA